MASLSMRPQGRSDNDCPVLAASLVCLANRTNPRQTCQHLHIISTGMICIPLHQQNSKTSHRENPMKVRGYTDESIQTPLEPSSTRRDITSGGEAVLGWQD